MDLGHWKYDGEFDAELYEGFIYRIERKEDGRAYIGRKLFRFSKKRPPLKGRKNKRHYKVDSDWMTYTGSCNGLNKDIEELGHDAFTYTIIELCMYKSDMAYFECKHIMEHGTLLEGYNMLIPKVPRPPKALLLEMNG